MKFNRPKFAYVMVLIASISVGLVLPSCSNEPDQSLPPVPMATPEEPAGFARDPHATPTPTTRFVLSDWIVEVGKKQELTVVGEGFEPFDVVFGEIKTDDYTIPVVGATANEVGAFISTNPLDLTGYPQLEEGLYILKVRDTSGNNATHPVVISDAPAGT